MAIADLLRARGLSPKKRFGQNFLTDPHAAQRIAEAATTPPGGTVLEIGAGLGALTRPLLQRAAHVVAVERDRDLVPILTAELAEATAAGKLTIVEGDALDVDWGVRVASGPRPHAIAGNLPYLITGKLLERAVGRADGIDCAVFLPCSRPKSPSASPPSPTPKRTGRSPSSCRRRSRCAAFSP